MTKKNIILTAAAFSASFSALGLLCSSKKKRNDYKINEFIVYLIKFSLSSAKHRALVGAILGGAIGLAWLYTRYTFESEISYLKKEVKRITESSENKIKELTEKNKSDIKELMEENSLLTRKLENFSAFLQNKSPFNSSSSLTDEITDEDGVAILQSRSR